MATLTVALATFNEEKNLPLCLDSIKDLANEIVIVDGSSTDKTVKVAKKYGARVKVATNKPIFHINKQMAIDMATKDWVLQLDADELVTPGLKKEILSVINHKPLAINGYWIPRKNWFLGRFLMKGGAYPDYTMRLYRRGKGGLPQKSVHEQAVVQGKVGYLKNPLIHLNDTTFKRYLIRWDRYTNLIRDELRIQKPGFLTFIDYLFIKPIYWFLLTYIRYKGFMDSWQGFVFSFFSSLRFPVGYLKYLKVVFLVLCFLLFVTGRIYAQDYVLPYPGFMPGHPLYKISEVVNQLQEWWSFGNFAKFKYHLSSADKKLVEAKTLFEYKQYLLASQALPQYEDHLTKAKFYLEQAKSEGKNITEKNFLFKSGTIKHREILERLEKDLPENFFWLPEKAQPQTIEIKRILKKELEVGREIEEE